MHKRYEALALILAALVLAGCAGSAASDVQESAPVQRQAPEGVQEPALVEGQAPDFASLTPSLGQYRGEVRFVASMNETPRQESVGEQLYVLFFDSRPQAAPLPEDVVAALSQLSSVARAPVAVLGDAEHRLDDEAGRAAVEHINSRYGLALSPADGPFLVMLPRHPLDPPAEGDIVNVVGFEGLPYDRIDAAIDSATGYSKGGLGDITFNPLCIAHNIAHNFSALVGLEHHSNSDAPPAACRAD